MKLTQELFGSCWTYDPETGIMRWKARAIEWFSVEDPRGPLWAQRVWNTKFAGKAVGTRRVSQSGTAHLSVLVFYKSALCAPAGHCEHFDRPCFTINNSNTGRIVDLSPAAKDCRRFPANRTRQGGSLMRYKAKSVAALQTVLGGWPSRMRSRSCDLTPPVLRAPSWIVSSAEGAVPDLSRKHIAARIPWPRTYETLWHFGSVPVGRIVILD